MQQHRVVSLLLLTSLWLGAGPSLPIAQAAKGRPGRSMPDRTAPTAETIRALRAAIEDLTTTFGDRYPKGREFAARLDPIERAADGPQRTDDFRRLQREALVANPLVSGQPILYIVRPQYRSSYHAIDTLFHTDETNTNLFQPGGAMKTITLAKGGEVKTLIELRDGAVRDPEVHFDSRHIVFALRRGIKEDYHIYEIAADGTGLRQLTSAPGVCDFDPLYLPDDDILFSSTREPKYNQCSQDIAANLFRMERDGANIQQIDRNNLFDNQASLMEDGRIIYARWEYVDRNFGDAHGLWTVNPDGTNHAIFWGNNTASPGAAYTPRMIPGTPQAICIFGPHHDHLWGALAILDRRQGLDGRDGIVRLWPPEAIKLVRAGGPFDCDSFSRVYPKYADPYPLSSKYFLCSRLTGQGSQMGIYLLDLFGNEILLHVEGPGCYDPMPLGPRPRPPVIPSRRNFRSNDGYFYLADVYRGTHMQGVRRGTIKSLRVVESPEKRSWSDGKWFGQGFTAPGMNWHSLENKRVLGTVPVEEDGSAYFAVPAEKFVYFQALDENGMMVQSMRSGAMVMPGETTGCVGCHDHRLGAPRNPLPPGEGRGEGDVARTLRLGTPSPPAPLPKGEGRNGTLPLALRHPPSKLTGWHGPPRLFGYMAEVQSVFNKHCLECHDYGKKGADKLVLAPDRDITFNAAYNELWRKGYTAGIGAGPAEVQPAYSWGSHASKLVRVLRAGHNDVKLSPEDWDRLVTWLDINAPYYSDYFCAYPNNLTGRSPLDPAQVQRLGSLTGTDFTGRVSHSSNPGPLVSFERPELSPCLKRFADKCDPGYKEALAIIQAGQKMLASRPRADMLGFVPCPDDLRREAKYEARRQIEHQVRQAIREGRKVYDPGMPRGGHAVARQQ